MNNSLYGYKRNQSVSMRLNSELLETALKKYGDFMDTKNKWLRCRRWGSRPYSYSDLVEYLLNEYLTEKTVPCGEPKK